ncbi:ligand of Numb protein X 2-like [Tachypleus tridentatus]|uniref:ligand of Numb protein X 2-like n=1 Tax=Tachypleus tridentatus TaxID=6853 RepID=UPI003FD08E3A
MDRKRLVRLKTWKFDHIWKKPSVANGVGLREVIHAVTTIEDFVDTTIVLKKDNNELGISVTGGNDTYLEAIVVTDVLRYGAAFQDGRLKRGDALLAISRIILLVSKFIPARFNMKKIQHFLCLLRIF